MISFKRLFVRNFLSVGNNGVEIIYPEQPGVYFVSGWNYDEESANGVGKTALFYDAPLFALFGEVYRGKVDRVINYKVRKDAVVELVLEHNSKTYKIVRGRKPNTFTLYENEQAIQLSSMKETQLALEEKLGINKQIFENLFFINVNHLAPLLLATPTQIREYFERFFFGRLIFRELTKMARADANAVKMQIVEREATLRGLEEQLKQVEELVAKQEERAALLLQEAEELERIYAKKAKELNSKYGAVDFKKIDELRKHRSDSIRKIGELDAQLKDIDKKIAFLTNNRGKQCPCCGQQIDEKHSDILREQLRQQSVDIANHKELLLVTIDKIDEALRKLEEQKNAYFEEMYELRNLKTKIEAKKEEAAAIPKLIEQIRQQHGVEAKIEAVKKELRELEQKFKLYSWLERQFQGPIMDWFVEYVRAQLNHLINYYIEVIGFPYRFELTSKLQLASNVVEFDNLSEGEKKLFNFILFFALYDVFLLRAGDYPSVIVFDELLDSALAEDRIVQVFRILKALAIKYNLRIFLLSHRGADGVNLEVDGWYYLEKRGGFTSLMRRE